MILSSRLKTAAVGSNKIQYVGGRTIASSGTSVSVTLSTTITGGIASAPSVGDLMIVVAAFADPFEATMTSTTANPMIKVLDLYSPGVTFPGSHLGLFYRVLTSADFTAGSNGFNFGVEETVSFAAIASYYRGQNLTVLDAASGTNNIRTLTKNARVFTVKTQTPSAGDTRALVLSGDNPMTLRHSVLPGTDASRPLLALCDITIPKPSLFTPTYPQPASSYPAAEIRTNQQVLAIRSAT